MINKDFKIANKVILELLREDDNKSICETLERTIDDELMKPDDQIDFDFIDECAKTIHAIYGKELPEEAKDSVILPFSNPERKFNKMKKTITRVALIAGITLVAAFAGNSISASAFHVNVFGNFVEWTQNKVVFNWQDEKSNSSHTSSSQIYDSLYVKLKDSKLTDVMLPNYNLKEYQLKDLEVQSTDRSKEVLFTLFKGNDYINYIATEFSDKAIMDKKTFLGQYSSGEEITINGTKFYILTKGESTRVLFRKQLTEYMLYTSYDVDTMKKILKTIK